MCFGHPLRKSAGTDAIEDLALLDLQLLGRGAGYSPHESPLVALDEIPHLLLASEPLECAGASATHGSPSA